MTTVSTPAPGAVFHAYEVDYQAISGQPGAGGTLRMSDLGYVDDGNVPYPPQVNQSFAIDRQLTLSPGATPVAATYGSLSIVSPDQSLETVTKGMTCDRLGLRILAGRKTWNPATRMFQNPPRSDLVSLFGGLAQQWQFDYRALNVPIGDNTYWLTQAAMFRVYGGSGGLDGTSSLAGRQQPRLRGAALNLTPVLVDPVNNIYQVSDAFGSISAVYEGGYSGGFTADGQVSDVTKTQPQPGHWNYQSNTFGLWIRLGSKPVYAITVDAYGDTSANRGKVWIVDIVRAMLLDDFHLPPALIDPNWPDSVSWFTNRGGWFWDGSAAVTAQDMVNTMLNGLGVRLVPTRTGTLLPIQLAIGNTGTGPSMTMATVCKIAAVGLDSSVIPPPPRYQVGYGHNFTVQNTGSGMHPQAPASQLAFAATEDRFATWSTNSTLYRVPNLASGLVTALQNQNDAQTIAGNHGALWGGAQNRMAYALDVPLHIAAQIDLGQTLACALPAAGLRSGALALVWGDEARSGQATSTIMVLV